MQHSFGSDNHSGVHAGIFETLVAANRGHVHAYGDDPYTAQAVQCFRQAFGDSCAVFFVFNGTGANVLSIKSCCRSYEAVIAASVAHIQEDECGAPEHFGGNKIIAMATNDGKLTPTMIEPRLLAHIGDQHRVQPKLISLTEASECGTVYSLQEIKQITQLAHDHGLFVHMDGARLANAAAFLNCSLYDITAGAGIDILSFGGTKNGLMFGESVVVFNAKLLDSVAYYRKQAMQLASKMRFIAAQFSAYLGEGLWLENARNANHRAQELASDLAALPFAQVVYKVEANELFVQLPRRVHQHLREKWGYYVWDDDRDIVRLVTSFDTTKQDVADLISDLKSVAQLY